MKRIITRAEAERRGLNRYFTGEPCRYGHVCERYVKREWCVECARAGNKPEIRVIRKYFTGKPCENGHISERFVASDRCVECVRYGHGTTRKGH